MAFYTPRNIGPADQVLFDADGNAVGIQAAGSSSQPVLGFKPTKHAAIDSLVSGDEIPSVTYNGAGKLSGFVSDGVAHTITYPDSNTITVTNSLGASRTVAVNSEGRVVAAV